MKMIVLLFAISGCSMTEERFVVDGFQLWCERSADCTGTFEVDACIDVMRSTDRSSCSFDSAAAQQCTAELEDAKCVDDPLLDLPVLQVPESCDAVWTCGGVTDG